MEITRIILQTDAKGQPLSLPSLPPYSWVEATFLVLGKVSSTAPNKPRLAPMMSTTQDKEQTKGFSPLPDDEWDVLL